MQILKMRIGNNSYELSKKGGAYTVKATRANRPGERTTTGWVAEKLLVDAIVTDGGQADESTLRSEVKTAEMRLLRHANRRQIEIEPVSASE